MIAMLAEGVDVNQSRHIPWEISGKGMTTLEQSPLQAANSKIASLLVAAACGASRQVIERLIVSGADINQRANPGTLMQIAQRHGKDTTVETLRDLAAQPNIRQGKT